MACRINTGRSAVNFLFFDCKRIPGSLYSSSSPPGDQSGSLPELWLSACLASGWCPSGVGWMDGLIQPRATRFLTGSALALAAAVLLAPAEARASCGDYVTVHTPSGPEAPTQPPGPTMPQAETNAPGEPNPPACPCRGQVPTPTRDWPGPCPGPGCSDSPAPPLASGPQTTTPPRDWACAPSAPARPEATRPTLLASSPSLPPARHGAEVYHPPR
jgi:hypothetical protein